MNCNIQGKVAVVTGASSGIGAQTARQLAKEGARVMINARNTDQLQTVQREIRAFGGTCEIFPGDVSRSELCAELVMHTKEIFGRVDILVYSAGMALRASSLDMTEEDWQKVMQVNLTAPMLMSQCVIRQMRNQGEGGKIVYVSSTAGKNVNPGASPSYGASKAGLLYLTRHFAKEFASEHIYVNAVCPGPVDTKITETWTLEHRASVLANMPMGRMGTPEDIANAIVFLASPLSDYITGESVLINGGRFME